MNNNIVDKLLSKFEDVLEKPTRFLELNKHDSDIIKSNIKEVYDYARNEEIQTRNNEPKTQLFVKNLDTEQIWQQLEIQNKKILDRSTNGLSSLIVGFDKLLFGFENKSIIEELDSHSEASESGNKNETISTEIHDDPDSESEKSEGESDSASDSTHNNKNAKNGVEDKFFKLSDMEDFLRREENKLSADHDNNSESDESEDDTSVDLFKEPTELDLENEAETAKFKDFFVKKDEITKKSNAELKDSDEDEYEEKSRLDIRQERLRKKVEKLEEQAISEKPWQLKGEINAENRPLNSLLEEVVTFDLTSRPAPIITEQVSMKLEDIIKQRIKDKVFDSVERKQKIIESPLEYKKRLVLDQEKSKQSLAQIYEEEYSKQKTDLNPDNAEKDEEQSKLHQEVNSLMTSLFTKLDALSNFHFTSKPTIPELKIINHLPAINMEEVAPVAASSASLLAPEEIKKRPNRLLIGKDERTASDKKRDRRHKKIKQKIHSKLKTKKEEMFSKNKKGQLRKLEPFKKFRKS